MVRKGRDWVAIALATAGVLAALSLAGIFIVYLVDTIGGDDSSSSTQTAGTSSPTGGTAATTPRPGASAPGAGASAPGAGGAGAGGAGADNAGGGGAQGGARRANRIPDNQQYKTFRSSSAGYTILYPEGWDESGSSKNKSWTFRLDFEHVIVGRGPKPTVERTRTALGNQKKFKVVSPPKEVRLNGKPAIKTTVLQIRKREGLGAARIYIDQYRMEDKGRTAAIDIGCPAGVYKPNEDAFGKIIESFRWL
jgi:hypothetical protein